LDHRNTPQTNIRDSEFVPLVSKLMELEMTTIINHADHNRAMGAWGFVNAVWNNIGRYIDRQRTARRIRREHEMLMAMSSHDLHDIGLVRCDVVFGIATGRGVSREA
jgi:uncharacterized protein YjiS (DUF1127 family)